MIFAMTRKEFSDRYDASTRSSSLREVWIFLLAIVAIEAPTLFLTDFIEKHYGTTFSDIFLLLMLFLLLGMIIAITTWLSARLVKRFGLACPTCACGLLERRKKVLLTGRCPKCGNKVFDEPDSKMTKSCGLNREEFRAKLEAYKREKIRETMKVLMLIFVVSVVCVPTTKYFQRLIDSGKLDWVTLTQWRWFAGLMLAALCFAFVVIFIFAFRGKLKVKPKLPCPECHRSLVGISGKATIETGMCLNCGCRLFEPSSSENVGRVSM
jgi:hypothetical protein